jgi:hypothetical protein
MALAVEVTAAALALATDSEQGTVTSDVTISVLEITFTEVTPAGADSEQGVLMAGALDSTAAFDEGELD